MAHEKVYGICANKCLVETMPKEEIEKIREDASAGTIDPATGKQFKYRYLTKAEYEALNGNYEDDTLYIITNDETFLLTNVNVPHEDEPWLFSNRFIVNPDLFLSEVIMEDKSAETKTATVITQDETASIFLEVYDANNWSSTSSKHTLRIDTSGISMDDIDVTPVQYPVKVKVELLDYPYFEIDRTGTFAFNFTYTNSYLPQSPMYVKDKNGTGTQRKDIQLTRGQIISIPNLDDEYGFEIVVETNFKLYLVYLPNGGYTIIDNFGTPYQTDYPAHSLVVLENSGFVVKRKCTLKRIS